MSLLVKKRVAIIGGGLAGLVAAMELSDKGFEVIVLEGKSKLGGRASNTIDRKMHDPVPIGPHVFVSAYEYFHSFLKKLGVAHVISWQRRIFLEIVHGEKHHQFKMNSLPGPLYMSPWLFFNPFLNWKDKISHFRIACKIAFSSFDSFEKFDDINAHDFLVRYGITRNSIDKFWRFFVMSLLNVPLELCSAAELALLLKHWTKWKKKNFGFAKVGLGDLYTDAAVDYIKERGGSIWRSSSVVQVVFKGEEVEHLKVERNGITERLQADAYISTANPIDLRTMLSQDILAGDFFSHLKYFEGVPYISVNIWFNKKVTHKKFWAMLNTSTISDYMNTDFYDQSNIYSSRKDTSLITSNIIYSKVFEGLSDSEIVKRTVSEIKIAFPHFDAEVEHSHVHRIPYVIYASLVGMRKHKLSHKTPVRNFYLAGDWTVKELTQCMESAVISGHKCVAEIIRDHS